MILFYLKVMLWEILPLVPLVLLLRLGFFFYHRKKGLRTTVLHETGVICFILFLCALASQTISLDFLFRGEFQLKGEINLIPLKGIVEILNSGEWEFTLVNLAGNVLIFLPIGLLIPLLWEKRRKFRWAALAGFLTSLLIECLQLFSFRGTDVDDLILNTLGACAGWLVFAAFERAFLRTVEKFRMQGAACEKAS